MRNINPFGLRMQPDLRTQIEEAAARNHRSLNAEIVARLESSLAEEDRVLHMGPAEHTPDPLEAVDSGALAAQAPDLAKRLLTVEHQLQQVIALLQQLKC